MGVTISSLIHHAVDHDHRSHVQGYTLFTNKDFFSTLYKLHRRSSVLSQVFCVAFSIECSTMMNIFYICAVQQRNHEPYVVIEHLNMASVTEELTLSFHLKLFKLTFQKPYIHMYS